MKISLVTSVFNRQSTIGETMASVQAQHYPDVEHVIQDGGSTDGTIEVINKWKTEKTFVVSARDNGIYDGINRGISRATGDVIGLLHSDDTLASNSVLADVAQALRDPAIDGIYGDLVYVAAENPSQVLRYWRSGTYHPRKLAWGWMPPHPTLYLRRSVFDHLGLYDTEFRIAADYEAMLRYLVRGNLRLGYIPQVMVRMRAGGESNRSLGHILKKSREDYRALRRHGVGGVGSLLSKNLSKVGQFLMKEEKAKWQSVR